MPRTLALTRCPGARLISTTNSPCCNTQWGQDSWWWPLITCQAPNTSALCVANVQLQTITHTGSHLRIMLSSTMSFEIWLQELWHGHGHGKQGSPVCPQSASPLWYNPQLPFPLWWWIAHQLRSCSHVCICYPCLHGMSPNVSWCAFWLILPMLSSTKHAKCLFCRSFQRHHELSLEAHAEHWNSTWPTWGK